MSDHARMPTRALEDALAALRASLAPDQARDPTLMSALARVAAAWNARQAEETGTP